ncbi:MAG: M24 family metallopeptidase [Candidatus Levybacteria bacterium]|nr:M24 family metallopeptidase [Candidatus Levybacteria bacterium]
MINIKTKDQIEKMKIGGHILAEVLFEVMANIKPGVSELELDQLAEKLILEKGGEPGFKKVAGYKYTICVSTNNVVVHGIPTGYKFKEGDVVGVDCGVYYKGFHTDMAETLCVSTQNSKLPLRPPRLGEAGSEASKVQSSDEIDKFLKIGKKALEEGIKVAKVGNRVGNISKTIQDIVEGSGYSIVRSLVGHGVGKYLHEEPEVPGFLIEPMSQTPKLIEGMTIAIEVIYNLGGKEVVYSNDDGWTISTADGSTSGLFERTVEITDNVPAVLTK